MSGRNRKCADRGSTCTEYSIYSELLEEIDRIIDSEDDIQH